MSGRLGLNGKLYRDTSAPPYTTPVWAEITPVRDVTLNVKKDEADLSSRATGGWHARLGALKDGTIDFEAIWDPSDGGFGALLAAFLNGTQLHMACMDGPIATVGSQGLVGLFDVLDITRHEPLATGMTATVKLALAPGLPAPTWLTVAS